MNFAHLIYKFVSSFCMLSVERDSFLLYIDTENIKLVFCAVKDTIMQSALKEFNLA